MKTRVIITSLAMFAMASTAFAQSTITGTLSAGGTNTGTGSSSLTGTVTGGTTTTGGGSTSGGGSGSNVIDICPNIAGTQSTLPSGYIIQSGGNCVAGSTTGGTTGGTTTGGGAVQGTTTGTPNVPNTGEGGNAAALLGLMLSGTASILGGLYLLRRRYAA